MRFNQSARLFDAVIVGSGATGGMTAMKLTEAGLTVALLEAGEKTTWRDFDQCDIRQSAYRPRPDARSRRSVQSDCYACKAPYDRWFVDDIDNPYTQAKPYRWIRMRVLGGRLLAWGRRCYRMSDLDFKAASRDGWGEDWPINYEDLVPYYEESERLLKIEGSYDRLPHLPDSICAGSIPLHPVGGIIRDSMSTRHGTAIAERCALVTDTRHGVHTFSCATSVDQQCPEFASFASPWTPICRAANTGRLVLITNAIASQILLDNGKASTIVYVLRKTQEVREIHARVVVLCASTLESTRLLLNSGICNSSGVLGHYLMDHIFQASAMGIFETPIRDGPSPHEPSFYVPRFCNLTEQQTRGFIRGYALQGQVLADPEDNLSSTQSTVSSAVRLVSFGECLARRENYIQIDPKTTDEWGIPVPIIHADWCDNELKMWNDSREQAAEILDASGAKHITLGGRISEPGLCIHETGTARMGYDPKTSVVNRFCQAHDVDNIFVSDGACWVSSGCQNPTLTMLALASRTADYIIHEYCKNLL